MTPHPEPPPGPPSATRRDFLQQAAGLAAGLGAVPAAGAAPTPADPLLPTVKLGPHTVTRLIIGGNPVYGYSHFNRHFNRHLTDWHTPERVAELLKRCEQAGLNCFQNSYAERTLADVDRYRAAGGTMHWLCLGKPDWDQHPEHVADAAKHKPIGIAPHGALADRLHRAGKLTELLDLLKRIRDTGVLVGLSCHAPALVELAEAKGWDVDYYMCALYHLTRPRAELEKLFGPDVPLGEVYLPSDPPRMFQAIKAVRKPCLTYKVLAAGRRVGTAAEVRKCFQTALESVKPTDALIVGMYQQFGDQVGENAALVRELGGGR
jgi:putative intracellular protease/amidase